MNLQPMICAVLLVCGLAHAQDVCRFTQIEIPRHEARLLELARVIEYRCECTLPKVDAASAGDALFIAERYQSGKCVSRQWFSLSKYSSAQIEDGRYKGLISFGWHMDDQKLVGVHDTGYFHQTGFAKLPSFHPDRPKEWAFFKESQAEPRASRSGYSFELYPIIGIRGSKEVTFQGVTLTGRTTDISSLPSEQLANAFKNKKDAVLVYLYLGSGLPDMDYDKKEAEPAAP